MYATIVILGISLSGTRMANANHPNRKFDMALFSPQIERIFPLRAHIS